MASMRRKKARLDKQNIAKLKSKNAEKSQDFSQREMQVIGDELVRSTVDSFERELERASPVIRKLAEQFSGMIQDFFVGYKEGVDTEIREYIKNANKSLEESVEKVSKPAKQIVDPSDVAKSITGRGTAFIQPKQSFGARAAQYGVAVLGGALGFDKASRERAEEMRRREAFIQTEMKLRPGVSRKQLKEDYAQIQTKTKELSKLEGESQLLKEQGYSEEQIDKLLNFQEKQMSILNDLIKADPSRLGKYKELAVPSAGKTEEEQQEAALVQKRALSEQEQQTTLLMEIKELLKGGAAGGAAVAGEGGPSIDVDIPSPGGILRRIPNVLRRIPGALRRGGERLGGAVKSIARGGLAAGRAAYGAAKGIVTGAARLATTPLTGIARFAAPLAAGLSVGEGISDLAEGKRVESVGDIVPEGWSKLNPFSWAMRGGMYAGEKINLGYGAISERLGGSGSLGSDIYEGVQKGKEVVSSSVERAKHIVNTGITGVTTMATRGIERGREIVSSGVERAQHMARVGLERARAGVTAGIEAAAPVVAPAVTRAREIANIGLERARAGVSAGIEATANAASRARESISSGLSSVSNWFGSKPVDITPQNMVPRQVSPVLRQQPVNQTTVDAAAAAAKSVTVTVPPPSVVTVPPPKQNVIMPSFVHSVRNKEPSVSDYIRRRYAT